jgi:pimeloyl-ACP methyl ester carboxylesterase
VKHVLKNSDYWKRYPIITSADEIEECMSADTFSSNGKAYELVRFYKDASADNILITPGSGGHAYVFAELGYLIHKQGYNVFIMPKHGGYTINELSTRHLDAIRYLRAAYPAKLHLFGEGLGGLVAFYVALGGARINSLICENSPAILTDKEFHKAMKKDGPAGKRRTFLLPFFRLLAGIFPSMPVPIKAYLGWNEMIDTGDETNRTLESRLVKAYNHDPDFDNYYRLKSVMSLVNTPPPNPISALSVPTMFIVARRGVIPSYIKDLFMMLPLATKKLEEVDGGVFWMVSNPIAASKCIAGWINTLKQSIPINEPSNTSITL